MDIDLSVAIAVPLHVRTVHRRVMHQSKFRRRRSRIGKGGLVFCPAEHPIPPGMLCPCVTSWEQCQGLVGLELEDASLSGPCLASDEKSSLLKSRWQLSNGHSVQVKALLFHGKEWSWSPEDSAKHRALMAV